MHKDKIRGCMIGGAVGDALGYPVEFVSDSKLFAQYGSGGMTAYELTRGKALISDDTQMTMFTANGLSSARSITAKTVIPQERLRAISRER